MPNTVCFLGYNRQQTRLVQAIENKGLEVFETFERMESLKRYDVVISFGYRHIIDVALLNSAKRPPINLHTSYLPFNRGAHPNFWSWVEQTPAGVTIHEIDEGIDTGPICYQRRTSFDGTRSTFSSTYRELFLDIENLFIENLDDILGGSYQATPQTGDGTYHRAGELPKWVDWDMPIGEAINRHRNDK